MRRVWAALRADFVLQARNQLYPISIVISLILVGVLGWLSTPQGLSRTIPMGLLLIVGGSTLMYVVAMILLEKEQGTLDAIVVSPLRPSEYLVAKVVSLSLLASLEGLILAGGTISWVGRGGDILWPSALLIPALFVLGAMHTLIGIILVARHRRIMEALLPMGGLGALLQIPVFYFVGVADHCVLLVIPSAAPCMLVRGALTPLTTWEWVYGLGYTSIAMLVLAVWAHRAFVHHIVHNGVRTS